MPAVVSITLLQYRKSMASPLNAIPEPSLMIFTSPLQLILCALSQVLSTIPKPLHFPVMDTFSAFVTVKFACTAGPLVLVMERFPVQSMEARPPPNAGRMLELLIIVTLPAFFTTKDPPAAICLPSVVNLTSAAFSIVKLFLLKIVPPSWLVTSSVPVQSISTVLTASISW